MVGFTPRERALGIHWLGRCVGPRAGLDNMEKRKLLNLQGLELHPLLSSPVASYYGNYAILAPIWKWYYEVNTWHNWYYKFCKNLHLGLHIGKLPGISEVDM
jgi:hypothetical protein